MRKTITFKQFAKDFRKYYKCEDVNIKDESEAEIIFYDLYDCDLFEFDYDNKLIELYF